MNNVKYGFEYCVTTGTGKNRRDIYYYDRYNELVNILWDCEALEDVEQVVDWYNKHKGDNLSVCEL